MISESIYVLGLALFYGALIDSLARGHFLRLAALGATGLPFLYGLTSLLYNRARALPEGREQRRSLYAAERSMQATVLYVFGFLTGAVLATLLWTFRSGQTPEYDPDLASVVFVIPLAVVLIAFGRLYQALRISSHRLLRHRSLRDLVHAIRRGD